MDGDDRNKRRPSKGSACESQRAAITRYLDGELSTDARAAVERHAERCPACRGEIEERGRLRDEWVAATSIASTPGDRAAIVDAARESMGRGRPGDERSWLPGFARRGERAGGGRRWWLGDLVTTAAVAASILMAVQIGRWRGGEKVPNGWASSSTVTVYGVAAPPRGSESVDTSAQIPRPF